MVATVTRHAVSAWWIKATAQNSKPLMATITGNIATATNTGQLTYDASRRKGGRFYSDARLRDICVEAVNVLRSGVWWCLFQEKWRMARHKKKKKQWMKSKNKKLMADSNSVLNPVTEHWLDTTTCEIKIHFSVALPFPLTEQKTGLCCASYRRLMVFPACCRLIKVNLL